MKRSAPPRRTPIARGRSRTKYARRERDLEYLAWVRRQPCLVAAILGCGVDCGGPIEADHCGERGLGQKAPDATALPMCRHHHRQRHDVQGFWRALSREQRREILNEQIAGHRAIYEAERNGVTM